MRPHSPARRPAAPIRAAWAIVPACLAALAAPAAIAKPVAVPAIADDAVALVQSERTGRGLSPLERRAALDEIALRIATDIAVRPRRSRLKRDASIVRTLREDGRVPFRQARDLVHLQSAHPHPAEGVVDGWRTRAPAWEAAMSPSFDAVGLATVRAADRWLVAVVILVADPPAREDLERWERDLFARINLIRAEHGLEQLAWHEALGAIARDHSDDMARRGYFDHVTPEGRAPSDRLRARGEPFARVSENIFATDVADDILGVAARSWMTSPGHRENILDPLVTEAGLGIAVSGDGLICFTQIFRRPLGKDGEDGPPGHPGDDRPRRRGRR